MHRYHICRCRQVDQVGIETSKEGSRRREEEVLKETLVESLVETDGEPDGRTARIVGNPNFVDGSISGQSGQM